MPFGASGHGTERMPQTWQRHVALLGVGIDDLTMTETLALIEKYIAEGTYHQIATANVDFLCRAAGDEELNDILRSCALTLADGMPLIWASKLLGSPLRERVAGADLVVRLLQVSEQKGYRIFMLGASPESSLAAYNAIKRLYPKAVVCGRLSPALAALDEMDHESILASIEEAQPDILLTAFGNPKQEKWLAMHKDRLHVPVCIGVGASLDFLSGKQSRAPRWMQRTGTEWMYRLGSHPRRLAGRYWTDGLFLARYFSAQFLAHSSQIRCGEADATFSHSEKTLEVRLRGNFTGGILQSIENELAVHSPPLNLLLNMSGCTYIGADGIGWLMKTSDSLSALGGSLTLISVHQCVIVALRAALMGRTLLTVASGRPKEAVPSPLMDAPLESPLSKVFANTPNLPEARSPQASG
jgi:N-acetylglucosaminyldiphosphoundecaprenol N-acetyl-beta-D-mannosaminyltransferase